MVNARTEQLQGTVRDLKRSYDVTLEALVDALENKDGETEGHARRVCLFGIAVAVEPFMVRVHNIGRLTGEKGNLQSGIRDMRAPS